MSGYEYVGAMLEVFEEFETIAKRSKEFKKYAEQVSALTINPIKASVAKTKEFNEISEKHASYNCPVNIYV